MLSASRYGDRILASFINQEKNEELLTGYYLQDAATHDYINNNI